MSIMSVLPYVGSALAGSAGVVLLAHWDAIRCGLRKNHWCVVNVTMCQRVEGTLSPSYYRTLTKNVGGSYDMQPRPGEHVWAYCRRLFHNKWIKVARNKMHYSKDYIDHVRIVVAYGAKNHVLYFESGGVHSKTAVYDLFESVDTSPLTGTYSSERIKECINMSGVYVQLDNDKYGIDALLAPRGTLWRDNKGDFLYDFSMYVVLREAYYKKYGVLGLTRALINAREFTANLCFAGTSFTIRPGSSSEPLTNAHTGVNFWYTTTLVENYLDKNRPGSSVGRAVD